MCIGTIYINVLRSTQAFNDDTSAKEYSYELSTEYISWGSCSYIHENAYAFCGESSLEDCRACKRQGCSVIQCGNDSNQSGKENFVK